MLIFNSDKANEEMRLYNYLNTSHVNLQLAGPSKAGKSFAHLNTSHVNLQLVKMCDLKPEQANLNTSHVNLQPGILNSSVTL